MRTELRAWGLGSDTGVFELAVSELVTNAIVHGAGAVDVTVSLAGDRVRMEVVDEGDGVGPIGPAFADPDAVGGWGLQVIEGLSDEWGARREADHTWVWMERRCRRGRRGADPAPG